MLRKIIIGLMSLVIVAAVGLAIYRNVFPTGREFAAAESLPRVAKVGQTSDPRVYVHSIEAFERLYQRGFRHFFVNLNWTSDAQLVCIGSWRYVAPKLFKGSRGAPLSHQEFTSGAVYQTERPCTFATLAEWLTSRPDAVLMPDIHDRAKEAYAVLAGAISNAGERIYPFVHTAEDKAAASERGFSRVIWPVSRFGKQGDDQAVLAEAARLQPFAVAVPQAMAAQRSQLMMTLYQANIPTYVYTIDHCKTWKNAVAQGARGVYTHALTPGKCKITPQQQ